jgi:hypothetical protein
MKVNTDGTGESTVWSAPSKTKLGYLNVSDGEAYFMSGLYFSDSLSYYSSICKVSLDGTDESTIWSTSGKTILSYLNVAGNEAYFASDTFSTNSSAICKVGLDGTGETKV